jgi:cobalt-zinc-cadmium efflux system outer membrane protein
MRSIARAAILFTYELFFESPDPMRRSLRLLVAAPLFAGCASTNPEPGFRDLAATIQSRTGHTLRWNRGSEADAKAGAAVRDLLAQPLTAAAAVQVALLRNPRLQATYEELSLAQADVVQAGLLSNPVLSADITTAEREALDPNLIVGLTQSFLDLLLIPAKTKIASSAFDQAKYRVGNAVLDLAAEVQAAYYATVAAAQTVLLHRTVAESEQAAVELHRAQREAGNVNDLTLASQEALYQQTRLEGVSAEADLASAREGLTRLMGLWGGEVAWRTADRLPELPAAEPPLDDLESRAIVDRLDLAAVRQEMQTLSYALHLAETSRWTGVIDIGADVARLKDGRVVVGPRGSIELPIFDQRRATVARLEAQLRASQRLLEARAIEVRSEVRDARNRLVYARQKIDRYRAEVIPIRERVVALSQQQYGAMLLGVYPLIQAKQAEINAYRDYITVVRDYWIARAELDRAVGGRLPGAAGSEPPTSSPIPSEAPAGPPGPAHHHSHP